MNRGEESWESGDKGEKGKENGERLCSWPLDVPYIYINDIGETLLSLTRLLTDDTSLGYSSSDKSELEKVVNYDLSELNSWSKKWLMSFNPDKTEIMVFSNLIIPNDFEFIFDDTPISITKIH